MGLHLNVIHRPRWAAAGGLLLAAALLAGCGPRAKTQTPPAAAAPPPSVVVTAAIARTVPVYEDAVAQTIAVQTVTLRAQIAGTLQQVAFKEGTVVRRGQTLFIIDQRPYAAALQSAQAQRATANAISRPSPRLPPVISTTRSVRSKSWSA